ncbi:tRNA:m(4)X modification enzyme TRM13 homolog [Lytechinus variegatus]|uniref:tRNA:m(4)X modification enzyme TRM13 homolog n=1 Tax=Lytechinus variegatus TaxID=7654 RepID=UPI001BB13CFE|nr:tRNA:m(4)X modification enzyme TRM13 homolog [Lytechinus variegatus]
MDEKLQCNFFVKKRKRLCRLIPGKGKRYCGEHMHLEFSGNQNGVDQPNTTERIPCPYDPHHTVAVKQLAKHVKVCNSRPKEQPIYYEKGINAGSTEYDQDLQTMRLADFSLSELQKIISKVESVFADHVGDIETEILHHDSLKADLENPDNGVSARKHLLQLDSLLGHMERLNLLQPKTCYVEFGAGRGRLSQQIQQAMSDLDQTSFLLIDRASVRHKRDSLYKGESGGHQYERINMDIENLVLGQVPTVCSHKERPVVAYTKHLCGVATDLALRCLMETRSERKQNTQAKMNRFTDKDISKLSENITQQTPSGAVKSSNNESSDSSLVLSEKETTDAQSINGQNTSLSDPGQTADENSGGNRKVLEAEVGDQSIVLPFVRGVVMALCCHHRCSWRTHIGKQFFREVGITERDFMALVRMSSWATCGSRLAKEEKADEVRRDGGKVASEDGTMETPAGSETVEELDRIKRKERIGEASDIPAEQESIVSSLGLSVPEREEIGFKCKRILDMARLSYLKALGLDAKLVYYVERNISPENAVLIAMPSHL